MAHGGPGFSGGEAEDFAGHGITLRKAHAGIEEPSALWHANGISLGVKSNHSLNKSFALGVSESASASFALTHMPRFI